MKSRIAEAIGLKSNAVALLWTDEKPEGALQFAQGRHGCFVGMLAACAVNGKTAVFDNETWGCTSAARAMGFGDKLHTFPFPLDCFYRFLTTGNAGVEEGEAVLSQMRENPTRDEGYIHMFEQGEGFKKTPALARDFINSMPAFELPTKFVVLKPLSDVSDDEEPNQIIMLADPHQVSALTFLANYDTSRVDMVTVVAGAGCHSVGVAYMAGLAQNGKAVLGLMDIFARVQYRKVIGDNVLSFTMPWGLFKRMEANVEGSFLTRDTWKKLKEQAGL